MHYILFVLRFILLIKSVATCVLACHIQFRSDMRPRMSYPVQAGTPVPTTITIYLHTAVETCVSHVNKFLLIL